MISETHNSNEEIRLILQQINNAWYSGNPDELNEFFHFDIVMKGPCFQTIARGRDACIQSYKDFLTQCTIKDYQQSEPDIDVWGDTAVSIVPWTMTYVLNGEEYTESGFDVFTFARHEGKWLAVWRTLVTKPG